jgi:hypothetical protein
MDILIVATAFIIYMTIVAILTTVSDAVSRGARRDLAARRRSDWEAHSTEQGW